MNIGIDLGTTNTVVSVLSGPEPAIVRFGDPHLRNDYVPSVIAFSDRRPNSGRDDPCCYGQPAKTLIGQAPAGYFIYQDFKMLLAAPQETRKKLWGDAGGRSPEYIVHRFCAQLIEVIIADLNLVQPQNAVLTVPDSWISPNPLPQCKDVIQALEGQGVRRIEVASECVAAGTFWLHCYRKAHSEPFTGHLLICHCGGRTFDFVLLKTPLLDHSHTHPTAVATASSGPLNGRAGIAFDQAVIDHFCPDVRQDDPPRFHRLVREFEQERILHADEITQSLKLYHIDPTSVQDKTLFTIANGCIEVTPRILSNVFNVVVLPDLVPLIEAISTAMQSHQIDDSDRSAFRVAIVGGFSLFFLVRAAIEDTLGKHASGDRRFESILKGNDPALAIAKGAALIASEMPTTHETCPLEIGLVMATLHGDGTWSRYSIPIMRRNTPTDALKEPVWCDSRQFIVDPTDTVIQLYIQPAPDPKSRWHRHIKDDALRSLVPCASDSSALVQIGLSFDPQKGFSVHSRNIANRSSMTSQVLGHLEREKPKPGQG